MTYDASLGAEEKMGSLFQPDTLVPTQYFETFRGKAHLEPEMSFMLAILEYALPRSRNISLPATAKGKPYSTRRRIGSWRRTVTGSFPSRISVRSWDLTHAMSVRDCCAGRK
jgi:hypothetical protein